MPEKSKKVLVLTAHPDDAEFFAGGTLAKMILTGAEVTLVIASDGDAGSFKLDRARLAEVRRMEALQAAGVLGVAEIVFLGHGDGELDRLEPGRLRGQFVRAIRQHRPDLLFAFDPFAPFEEHPDHRAAGFAAVEAAGFSALPLCYPEQLDEGLEPHRVAEKYFFAKRPTHADQAVDISDTLELKIAAILEHRSQVDFLFASYAQQAELAGVDIAALFPEGTVEGEQPGVWIAQAVRERARANGAAVGLPFAERFRHVRLSRTAEMILQRDASDESQVTSVK